MEPNIQSPVPEPAPIIITQPVVPITTMSKKRAVFLALLLCVGTNILWAAYACLFLNHMGFRYMPLYLITAVPTIVEGVVLIYIILHSTLSVRVRNLLTVLVVLFLFSGTYVTFKIYQLVLLGLPMLCGLIIVALAATYLVYAHLLRNHSLLAVLKDLSGSERPRMIITGIVACMLGVVSQYFLMAIMGIGGTILDLVFSMFYIIAIEIISVVLAIVYYKILIKAARVSHAFVYLLLVAGFVLAGWYVHRIRVQYRNAVSQGISV